MKLPTYTHWISTAAVTAISLFVATERANAETVKISSVSLSTFSQAIVANNEPLVVEGKSYPVLNELSIIVNRNSVGSAIMTIRSDGRYELVRFLSSMTQERKEAPAPEPHQLYRLAEVLDTENGKTLQVAIPIRFNPPINPVR